MPNLQDNPLAHQYAAEHRRYLQENRPDLLARYERSDRTRSYLSSVGEEAADLESRLMAEYQARPEVKALPYQARVRALQSRQAEVQELVRHDLILQPVPEREE